MMKTTLTHSLTLRISPELNLMILDAAYEARLSKAAWIRKAINHSLGLKQRRMDSELR
jgi:predicted HicB family RNase H-like nuclease